MAWNGTVGISLCGIFLRIFSLRSLVQPGVVQMESCATVVLKTLNHISQQCFSTHRFRSLIHQHNAIAKNLIRSLEQREHSVHNEPLMGSEMGKDLSLTSWPSTDYTLVIDAQYINDQFNLQTAHKIARSTNLKLFAHNLNIVRI